MMFRKTLTVCAVALALMASAAVIAACGSSSSKATSASSAPTHSSTAASSSSAASQRLTASQTHILDGEIAQFNRAASHGQDEAAAIKATSIAAVLSGIALAHQDQLRDELTAASDAWVRLSTAILHGTTASVAKAEQDVRATDSVIPRG
jgi:hypothetical protein